MANIILFGLLMSWVANTDAGLVDISHPFDETSRNWPLPGYQKFNLTDLFVVEMDGSFIISKDVQFTEHVGTHMDAPFHFGKTAWDIGSIPIENFVVPVVKLDVREKCAADRDYAVSVEDLRDWEEAYGEVPENAVILIETGWGDKYSDSEAYYGTGRDVDAADFNYTLWSSELHFPGYSLDLATELLDNYIISGTGTDAASLDVAIDANFPVHFKLQGEGNKYGLENLCCLDQVPASGATLMAIPPALKDGSGFPIRAIVDTDSTFAFKQNSGMRVGMSFAVVLMTALVLSW